MNAEGTGVEHHPLLDRRNELRKRVRAFSHLVPAVLLVQGSVLAVRDGDPGWIQVAEFAVGASYLTLLAMEWRRSRKSHRAHHGGPEWLELAAAGIAALEGLHILHSHHQHELISGRHSTHILPWLYGAVAVMYVVLAFAGERLESRRGLRFTEHGFQIRRVPVTRSKKVAWEIAQRHHRGPERSRSVSAPCRRGFRLNC